MRIGRIIAALTGALGGYLYYHYVGCMGSCAIWNSVWRSAGIGALMGFLLWDAIADLFFKKGNELNQ